MIFRNRCCPQSETFISYSWWNFQFSGRNQRGIMWLLVSGCSFKNSSGFCLTLLFWEFNACGKNLTSISTLWVCHPLKSFPIWNVFKSLKLFKKVAASYMLIKDFFHIRNKYLEILFSPSMLKLLAVSSWLYSPPQLLLPFKHCMHHPSLSLHLIFPTPQCSKIVSMPYLKISMFQHGAREWSKNLHFMILALG